MIDYVWLIPIMPLVGVVINGLAGGSFSKKTIGAIGCATVGVSFLLSCFLFSDLMKLPAEKRELETILYTWIGAGGFKAAFGFLVDPLSVLMMLVVSGVSFLIHIYSIGYMEDTIYGMMGYRRYFVYLNLFVFFMLTLVSANNYLLLFVGWEGVGLCSYLLIGYEHLRKAASDAGKKAFIVNRIGDFGFLLGMLLIFVTFGTLNFREVFSEAPHKLQAGGVLITAITLLLFVGATGKSAQIPLYVWLPDAMEGPTPVSALIHAATMVTAGVYMVARSNVLYMMAPMSMAVVALIGGITAFYAATIGLAQNDIKRVLAYSTISQLGYMFLACGVGAFSAGIFHLMTHAFFKALLFLGAGCVMHAMNGKLDMRYFGNLKQYMPWTFRTFLIATLAICGIFPFAGFFSKDEILWKALTEPRGHVGYWAIGFIAAGLTALYMFRAVFMTFYGKERFDPREYHHLHEAPNVMVYPLMALAFLSIVGGFVGIPIIEGGNRIHDFLHPVMKGHELVKHLEIRAYSHGMELLFMILSLAIAGLGIYIAYVMYMRSPELPEKIASRFRTLYKLLLNKYYMDEIYGFLFVKPFLAISTFFWLIFDNRIVDGTVNGVAYLAISGGRIIRRVQTGYVQNYALSIVLGFILIILYYIFK